VNIVPEVWRHGLGIPAQAKACQRVPVAAQLAGQGVIVQLLAVGIVAQGGSQEERVRLNLLGQSVEMGAHDPPWRWLRFFKRSLICLTWRRCSPRGRSVMPQASA